MPDINSYLIIADNKGNVIPGLDLRLKDGVNTYNCNFLNGKYNYSCPSGLYDVHNEGEGTIIISDFYVYPQLIKREWWIAGKTLTDGATYAYNTLQDVYGEYLPSPITNPKIMIANNIGTRSVSFENIGNVSFDIKLGDSGTPATVTADLHIIELNV